MTKQEWREYIDHLKDDIYDLEEEIGELDPIEDNDEICELQYQIEEMDCEIFDIEQRLGEME